MWASCYLLPPCPTQCLGHSSYSMKKEVELWQELWYAKPAYQVAPPGNTPSSVAQPLFPEYSSPSIGTLLRTSLQSNTCPRRQRDGRMDRQTRKIYLAHRILQGPFSQNLKLLGLPKLTFQLFIKENITKLFASPFQNPSSNCNYFFIQLIHLRLDSGSPGCLPSVSQVVSRLSLNGDWMLLFQDGSLTWAAGWSLGPIIAWELSWGFEPGTQVPFCAGFCIGSLAFLTV